MATTRSKRTGPDMSRGEVYVYTGEGNRAIQIVPILILRTPADTQVFEILVKEYVASRMLNPPSSGLFRRLYSIA